MKKRESQGAVEIDDLEWKLMIFNFMGAKDKRVGSQD